MRGTNSDQMKRGFKAYTEKCSAEARSRFGLLLHHKLDPWKFLRLKKIRVWEPGDIPGLDTKYVEQLTIHDPESWSGATVKGVKGVAIIVNSAHAKTRQANTLMHEWAHLELNHKPNRVEPFDTGILMLSDYPADQEEEADWLAGAMLAPREGIAYWVRHGDGNAEIALKFGISEPLVIWRRRMTGIDRQFRR